MCTYILLMYMERLTSNLPRCASRFFIKAASKTCQQLEKHVSSSDSMSAASKACQQLVTPQTCRWTCGDARAASPRTLTGR